MDIKQLSYFISIVDNNFNISVTAKKLHISQPALSKSILSFEENENTELFIRQNGRLKSLTVAGEIFYNNAKQIIAQYNIMIDELRSASHRFKGKIRLGIPPLVLGVVFSEVLTNLVLDNPDINFEIIETGAYELKKLFLLEEIDLAILLSPSNIDKRFVQESVLYRNELSAFMSESNILANNQMLHWKDIDNKEISIFDSTFMIHHMLLNTFKNEKIAPKISLQSTSWDFLLQSTKKSNLITILPSPIKNIVSLNGLVEKKFYKPIIWEVMICRPIKDNYSYIEEYVYSEILTAFNKMIISNKK